MNAKFPCRVEVLHLEAHGNILRMKAFERRCKIMVFIYLWCPIVVLTEGWIAPGKFKNSWNIT